MNTFKEKIHKDEGIVIKRRNFKDFDKVITVYSKKNGKITLLAKGIRKPTSKRSSSLELFNKIKFSFTNSDKMPIIIGCTPINNHYKWKSFLGRIMVAYQLVEILDKTTPDMVPNSDLYSAICNQVDGIISLKSNWAAQRDDWIRQTISLQGFGDITGNNSPISIVESIIGKKLKSLIIQDKIRANLISKESRYG